MAADKLSSFANAVLYDWQDAMQRFFEKVEDRRERDGLSEDDVRRALDIGYGADVADAWSEWIEG